MNPAWRVLKNSTALSLAVLMEQGIAWFVPWYVARVQGREDWGYYSTALTFVMIAAPLAFWGLDQLLPREVARDRSQAGLLLTNAGVVGGLVSLLATGLALVVVYLLDYPPSVQVLTYLGLILILLPRTEAMLCEAVINGLERMEWIVLVRFPITLLRVGCSIFLLSRGFGLQVLFFFWAVYYVLASGTYVFLLVRMVPAFKLRLDVHLARRLAVQAFPFVATIFIGETSKNIDRVFLSKFQSTDAVGLYTAGTLLVLTLYLIAPAIMNALFPGLSRAYLASKPRFSALVSRLFRLLFVCTFPVALTIFSFADLLILLIFGKEYVPSITVLRIYALGIVPSFLGRLLYRSLLASDNERLVVRVSFVNGIAGIFLNLLLIPRYGLVGASIAAVSLEFLGLIQNLFYVSRRVIRFDFSHALLLPAGCALIGVLLYLVLSRWNPLAAWVFSVAGFITVAFLTGVLNREDLSMFSIRQMRV